MNTDLQKSCVVVRARLIGMTIVLGLTVALALPSTAGAQDIVTSPKYTAPQPLIIGSPNTVTADPEIPRPSTTPCAVELFREFVFGGHSGTAQSFTYVPPVACLGPWAKVVLEADFAVEAGAQFDRTATIWLAGTNIYFGTTAEPSSRLGRTWHTQTDLTDYNSLFELQQTGQIILPNFLSEELTSPITVSARVLLYPLEHGTTPPEGADVILPLANTASGGVVSLKTPTAVLANTFEFPTNIERVYMDVFAQSQGEDEFWYACVPNDVAEQLQSCSGTAFREAEITIDGVPAGVAPIYPWIYTGGTNPIMWRPIPGVQTLNFPPYRIDLTPFAGELNDGWSHEVAISVFNANNFAVTASVLLYLDEGSNHVAGELTKNTVGTADPVVRQRLVTGAVTKAKLLTRSVRDFELEGFLDTSHGRVHTNVSQRISFSNRQRIEIAGTDMTQDISQETSISSTTTTRVQGRVARVVSVHHQWPLAQDDFQRILPDGTITRTTSANQQRRDKQVVQTPGLTQVTIFSNVITPSAFAINPHLATSEGMGTSSQYYSLQRADGTLFARNIVAALGVLTHETEPEKPQHHANDSPCYISVLTDETEPEKRRHQANDSPCYGWLPKSAPTPFFDEILSNDQPVYKAGYGSHAPGFRFGFR